jgi:hypothetical protein
VHLLVERGIHIIEALNLEEAARDGASEFRGGAGSPIRPIGVVAG